MRTYIFIGMLLAPWLGCTKQGIQEPADLFLPLENLFIPTDFIRIQPASIVVSDYGMHAWGISSRAANSM